MDTQFAPRIAPRRSLGLAGAAHAADTRAAQLNTLYAEFWEENLKLNPVSATFAGDPRYNAELPNFLAPEFEEKSRAFEQKYLDAARAIGTEGSRARTGSRSTSSRSIVNRRSSSSSSPTGCCPSTSSTTSPTPSRSSVPAPARSRLRR